MGVAFDDVCILWQSECGSQGSCMYYDNRELSINFTWLIFGVKAISFVAIILANIFYRPPKIGDDIVVEVEAVSEDDVSGKLALPEASGGGDGDDGVKNGEKNEVYDNDSDSSKSSNNQRKNQAFCNDDGAQIEDVENDHF